MIRRSLAVLVPLVMLVACSSPAGSGQESEGGGGGGESSAATESAGGVESAAASVAGGGGGGDGLASVDLSITGGDYAGHYVVEITGDGGCSTGAVGAGVFSVASITVDPASAFGGPQIVIYDQDAAAGGTDQFSAAFPFNSYAYTVEVNPYLGASQGSDFGSGTATLDNRGSTATVTIEGTTAAGEEVQATIECHTVTNF